jgi:hypothetical protein
MNGSGNPARQNECPDPVAGRADAETRKIAAALSSQLASIKNTDMGGDASPAEPADSAAGLYKVITGTPPKALRFFACDGKTLHW